MNKPSSAHTKKFFTASKTPSGRYQRREFLARGNQVKTKAPSMKEILERLVCQDIKQMSYEERERSKSVHSSGEEESGQLVHALRDIEHAKTNTNVLPSISIGRGLL